MNSILTNDTNLLPDAPSRADRNGSNFFSTMLLSILLGVVLLGSLIHFAGPWNILANTRLLNLAINAGFIKYHDRDAGFIEGVADHIYFLKSQEPVELTVIFVAIPIFMLFWLLKSIQFHDIARYHGISGSFGQHARAYLTSLRFAKFTPLHMGDAAATAALQAEGAAPRRIYSTLYLFRLFVVFEIIVYALFALLGIGWGAWLGQVLWALVMLGILHWWTRVPNDGLSFFSAAKIHIRELLHRPARLTRLSLISLAAQGLDDVGVYLLAMAFSTQQVLLHVDLDLAMMALVAGYFARLIPLSPWGIGQFEWGFTAALVIGGMGLPEAATLTLIYSFFYYVSFLLFNLVTLSWRGTRVAFRAVLNIAYNPPPDRIDELPAGADQDRDALVEVPAVPPLYMPAASVLWRRGLIVAGVALAVFFFDQLTLLLSDFWLLESLGFSDVFWTNFRIGAVLFVIGALAFAAGVIIPALTHALPRKTRQFFFGMGVLIGLVAGYLLALQYQHYLLWMNGLPFGEIDPVFGLDVGFYVFTMPAWWVIWQTVLWLFIVMLAASILCAHMARGEKTAASAAARLTAWFSNIATLPTLVAFAGLGITIAVGTWLSRYSLLLKDSYDASVFTGASFIDVEGLFSTLNQIQITAVIVVGLTAAVVVALWGLRQQVNGRGLGRLPRSARVAGLAAVVLIGADFAFAGAVSIRNTISVVPDQPVIQLPYIQRHIDATRQAYGMAEIEEIEFVPRNGDDPLPPLEEVLESSAIRNAPLWPTYVTYLEQIVDPQHANRILQTAGDSMIYGPSLEIFQQQQKLRTYYDFLGIDVLRYTIDGERIMLASSVRELPILEPQPWLAWWGQRFMLFTHGHGLVMAPVGETTSQGDPVFVSGEIPVETRWAEITPTNHQVYYGEGNASMAVSNVRNMAELDYPTEQGRAEIVLPENFPAGVVIDSPLKRVVFGWRSGEFWEMVFSSLITTETRVHYFRQPLQRLEHIAPFLYFESNPYATVVEGDITWLVNAVTTSDQYPYSQHEDLGDKSVSRTPQAITTRRINYIEDSVKATLNAATGQVQLYQIGDAPVINTWANIYPTLFTDAEQMPPEVRQQLTYPLQLFHLQFDDLYIYYHMNDPMYFFNMEDIWDDADEVLGPVLDQGKAITFSMEPYHMLVETGGVLPAAAERDQFVMTMAFTPEGARNLRAVPVVYQDGEDYGRLFVLMVPKGLFITSPEQADAIIDQDPDISQQISWWNRRGTEVIRGHTSLLLVDDEVVYVEPVFIRSQQNSVTQLKRVIVVVRGQAYMSGSLEESLQMAYGAIQGETVIAQQADAENVGVVD
jgi:hypothetical protein